MLVDTVNELVLEFQERLALQGTDAIVPWGWFCARLVSLVSSYPSGVTKAILLAEIDNAWKKLEKFQTLHGTETLRSIAATKQLSARGVLEVYLRSVTCVEGTHTKIAVIEEAYGTEDSTFTLKMYLHRKLYDMVEEIMRNKFRLRFTGCRLSHSHGDKSMKLLPSENFIVIIDENSVGKLTSKFATLQGFEEYTESQYISGIKVKIVEIGATESIHNENGQTLHKVTITVVDDVGIQVKFVLWEEYLIMYGLFEEGDTLYIKNCFLVLDTVECYLLEYGPETIIYCHPFVHAKELVPSQTDPSKRLYVFKNNKGKLDYSMYPERLTIGKVKTNMCNVTLYGLVVDTEPKILVRTTSGVTLVKYNIKVQDESGVCTVFVTDRYRRGTVVRCGHFVLMTNLYFPDDCNSGSQLHLHNEKEVAFWNVSSMEGWLTTTSICHVTPLRLLDKNTKFSVVRGTVTDLKAASSEDLVVRVHCSCGTRVGRNVEQKLYCGKCNSHGMVEVSVKNDPTLFKLDNFWKWEYNICVVVMESADVTLEVNATNEVAEKLVQTSPCHFQTLEKRAQQRVLECTLGQQCCFGICDYNGELFLGVATPV